VGGELSEAAERNVEKQRCVFNKKANELATVYGKLVRWNEEIRAERDEARELAEELRDELITQCPDVSRIVPYPHALPWEVK
jgi:hypothetical protein